MQKLVKFSEPKCIFFFKSEVLLLTIIFISIWWKKPDYAFAFEKLGYRRMSTTTWLKYMQKLRHCFSAVASEMQNGDFLLAKICKQFFCFLKWHCEGRLGRWCHIECKHFVPKKKQGDFDRLTDSHSRCAALLLLSL